MYLLSLALLAFLYPGQDPAANTPQDWSDRAWDILHAGLEDKNADRRSKAVHALGLLEKQPKAQTFAEKALDDENAEVRVQAAGALAQMGAKSSEHRLEQAINDTDIKVAVAAANALYQFKDPVAYDVYYALLTGERKGPGLVKGQLESFKDRKQVEKLMLETGIGFVPFGGMGWEAFRTLTHDDSSPVRALAADKLTTDPDPKTSEALAHACSDKQWRIRAAAVDAIAKRGDVSLLPSVRPLLYDDNDEVRFDAAASVIRLGGRAPAAAAKSQD
jgi:HEAT repeat protein